nr:hypothetical protein [Catenibacterium mitsuokai]
MKRFYFVMALIAIAIFTGGFLLGQKWESHKLLPVIKLQEEELGAYHKADAVLAEKHRQERDAQQQALHQRVQENLDKYCELP